MTPVDSSGDLRPEAHGVPAEVRYERQRPYKAADPDLSQASLPELREIARPALPPAPDSAGPDLDKLLRQPLPSASPNAEKTCKDLDDGDPKSKAIRDCAGDHTPWRADLFEKCCEPWVLHGRQDIASFIYYGGLSSTGYAWRDLSVKVFERSGFHTEVHSLAGHNGEWETFKNTTHRQWVDDIVSKASKVNNPVFFGYSTSCLAAIVAAAENPGLFKGLVLVAPPVQLRSGKHSVALTIAEFLCSKFPNAFHWLEKKCVKMRGDSEPTLATKQTKRSPHFNEFPGPVVFSLKRLQREAWKALKKIDIPIVILQGQHDGIVAPGAPAAILKRVKSEQKQHRLFPESTHSVMLGLERKEVLREVCSWLRDVCLPTLAGPEALPDMKTRLTRQAAAGLVMGTIWARFRELGLLNESGEPVEGRPSSKKESGK